METSSSWFSCNIKLWTGLARFQVDIEIYEDKLGQSGDRILSSHIAKIINIKLTGEQFYCGTNFLNTLYLPLLHTDTRKRFSILTLIYTPNYCIKQSLLRSRLQHITSQCNTHSTDVPQSPWLAHAIHTFRICDQ